MLEKPYEIHILDGSILKISEFYSAPVTHGTTRTAFFQTVNANQADVPLLGGRNVQVFPNEFIFGHMPSGKLT